MKLGEIDVVSKLPLDVVFDIFARLPLKTISQCRWVCKRWYDVVLHPRFAQVHFASNRLQCFAFRDRYRKFYMIDNECFDNFETQVRAYNLEFNEFKENFKAPRFVKQYEVVGSVNGLICFAPARENIYQTSKSRYYICNPITGYYLMLPKSPKNHIRPIASGFGFDSLNNVYKVLRILSDSSENVSEVEVYTFGSDCWRVVALNVPYISDMNLSNVHVNNCLYWVACTSIEIAIIVSFNMATEEFSTIQLPNIGKMSRTGTLIVLRKQLCLIIDGLFDIETEMWEMKFYRILGSLAEEYVIQAKFVWEKGYKMMELIDSKLLLLYLNGLLGYFDSEKMIFNSIQIRNRKRNSELKIDIPILFMGSLFSPSNLGYH
ncbi:hypothetical protein IFM89_038632 [Coptis chinensis]|uniref:F-box domain-containing protein n=1 Tax=Coptis chinensis TaxID=261450 RepID=A0A835I5Z2_9MAGN|nr:hypothetical protein IFM89_038632 [Coptis chinensis]